MAQLSGLNKYDKTTRRDLQELQDNLWFGVPVNQQKAGNFRAIYLIIDLTDIAAGTTFGVKHNLGEVPVGYFVVGTATSRVTDLAPGTEASGARIAWTSTRIYLKAPDVTNVTVTLFVWAQDSTGE